MDDWSRRDFLAISAWGALGIRGMTGSPVTPIAAALRVGGAVSPG